MATGAITGHWWSPIGPNEDHANVAWLGVELMRRLEIDRFFREHMPRGKEGIGWAEMAYDVTSTYFEGQAKSNPSAKRSYSRDQRGDCKQVCNGVVVTRDGSTAL